MHKLTLLIAAGCFAAAPLLAAGNESDSATKVQNEGEGFRMACTVPYRNLNLTDEQRKKMSEVVAEHHKVGCTEASEARFMAKAKKILTPEQMAKFKASYEAGPKMKM